jgi:hypothetical protein
MGNSEFKRRQAAKHNMLRVENEAHREHKLRFPTPKRPRTRYSRGGRHNGLNSGAMMATLLGIGVL